MKIMNWIILSLPKKSYDVNDLTKALDISHYNESDENNEVDSIVPSKKCYDVNNLTISPDMSR